MDVSFQDVSVQDIKEQLQLLGHEVPDDLVSAYLREIQEQSYPLASHVSSADVQRQSNFKSATDHLETADTVPTRSVPLQSQVYAVNEGSLATASASAPSGDRRSLEIHREQAVTEARVAGEGMPPTETAGPRQREMADAATRPAGGSPRGLHKPAHAAEDTVDQASHADSLHPDHLLPEDVLQRARSIINEHLAEHQMPLVDSLSDFNLHDVPRPDMVQTDAHNVHGVGVSARSRTKHSGRYDPFQVSSTPGAHKIPHTAVCGSHAHDKQKQRPSTARASSIGPNRRTPTFLTTSALEDCENDADEPDLVDDLMARLRRGASTRRSALESLDGSIFNSELDPDHHKQRSGVTGHGKRRPATSGAQRHDRYGSSRGVSARAQPHMHRFSHHTMGPDEEDEFEHSGNRDTRRLSSPERSQWRPQVNLNSSFLTGRSCLSGQTRKVDRVARYQQLSQQWNRDPFLSATRRRRNQGFQEAFTAAHERSKADLDATKAMKSAGRPSTAGSRPYVPPGEKRRDQLRWDIRTRMQMQDGL